MRAWLAAWVLSVAVAALCIARPLPAVDFIRGDDNADGDYDIADAVFGLNVLFRGQGEFVCEKAADANDDGSVDLSDSIFSLSCLFLGGRCPTQPFPGCGPDPTSDPLTCGAFPPCGEIEDCNANGVADREDLAAGTSLDCNENGVPDECDTASGASQDCDADRIPDECQDCDQNGIADACDVLRGTTADCNGNGVLDSCERELPGFLDCNQNGVPDDCEPDCDSNGAADECDILEGRGRDCNGDGVLDLCQLSSVEASDCNANGVLDACDLESRTSFDLEGDGIPDDCQPHCTGPCDAWETFPAATLRSITYHRFEVLPIPAGFFGPGSEPFAGLLVLRGVPLDPDEFGPADTLVRRERDPFAFADPPGPLQVSVEIQIVALRLFSTAPIPVIRNRGQELWDVEVQPSPFQQTPGRLTATKTHPNGGTFNSALPVVPRMVFRRVGNPSDFRVLDAGELGLPPIVLTSQRVPWVHRVDPSLALPVEPTSRFVPGVEQDPASGTQRVVREIPEEFFAPDQIADEPDSVHVICPNRCTIRITEIQGARKHAMGDFSQLADPHAPARIFVDTIAGGEINGVNDQQHVDLKVQLGPRTLDRTRFEVRWEVRDRDDPANHRELDPNDGGTENAPLGAGALGGDNYDRLPEQGAHFFRRAMHDIRCEMSPGSDPADPDRVIGKAKTAIDDALMSSVRFHYSDEGGDNYVIRAICERKVDGCEDGTAEAMDETALLCVWRKRDMKAYAMASNNAAGVLDAFPAGAGRFALFIAAYGNTDRGDTAQSNRNPYVDFVCANADKPARVGSKPQNFFLGAVDQLGVTIDGGAEIVVAFAGVTEQNATAAQVLARFTAAAVPGVSVRDNRVIIDAAASIALRDAASDPILQLFVSQFSPTGTLTGFRTKNPTADFTAATYALYNTTYHRDNAGAHPAYSVQVVGSGNRFASLGVTNSDGPHSYVNVEFINGTRVRVTSADYPGNEFPIDAGDMLTITTNLGAATVTFAGAAFDGSVPVADVVAAINAQAGGSGVTAGALVDGRIRLEGADGVTTITVTNTGIADNLGFPAASAMTKTTMNVSTAIHETGHSLINQGQAAYHTDHTRGSPCTAYDDYSQATIFCPRHVRRLRENVARRWSAAHAQEFDSQ